MCDKPFVAELGVMLLFLQLIKPRRNEIIFIQVFPRRGILSVRLTGVL